MSFKIHLLKKAIIDLQDLVEEFRIKALCGTVSIRLSFFKGGITGLNIIKDTTEK